MPGTNFFTWPKPHVQDFLGSNIRQVAFIPYAAVTLSYDHYLALVSKAFEPMGYHVSSVHAVRDKQSLLEKAGVIVVGGGNTFALVNIMYSEKLMKPVREQVSRGKPYIGWSAGANLACPTLMTTNDMPVVQPPSFETLNLVPFQINPHYHELKFQNQGGETRRERIEEFLVLNPQKKVIGLPEGMLIRRDGKVLKVVGEGTAKLFQAGKEIVELRGNTDVGWLIG